MTKITLFNGSEKSQVTLPSSLATEGSLHLLAQAHRVYEDRGHKGTKAAQTRATVNITKKKIYKQKGTGGARHGAASAPIFVGGGAAHGPKPIKRILKLPLGMRKKALKVALFEKTKEGRVVALSSLEFTKTKQAHQAISKISKESKLKKGHTVLLVFAKHNAEAFRAIRNISNVDAKEIRNLNASDVVNYSMIILDGKLIEKTKVTKKA